MPVLWRLTPASRHLLVRNSRRKRNTVLNLFLHWKRTVRRCKLLREAFINRILSSMQRKAVSYAFSILRLNLLSFRFQQCFSRFQALRHTSNAMTAWKAVMSFRFELRRRGRLLFDALNQLLAGSFRLKSMRRFLIWRIATIHRSRLKALDDHSNLRNALHRYSFFVFTSSNRHAWQVDNIEDCYLISAEKETSTNPAFVAASQSTL